MAVNSSHPVHAGRKKVESVFYTSPEGNPTGGHTSGEGITIGWQDGVKNPNGAILEDLIEAAMQRLEFFQASKFACEENAEALLGLRTALGWLEHRTKKRQARGVEGTYQE